jgi:ankyrin repeat protein
MELRKAFEDGDIEEVIKHTNEPLLHIALRDDYDEMTKLLIESGLDLDMLDNESTPLYLAAQFNKLELVDLMLAKKVDVNKSNKLGQTPLHIASRNGNIDVINSLIKGKAHVDSFDKYGWTPLDIASRNGKTDIVKALVCAEANTSKFDKYGYTPLHIATCNNQVDVVKVLLEANADVNMGVKNTPLHLAAKEGNVEIIHLLLCEKPETVRELLEIEDLPEESLIKIEDYLSSIRKKSVVRNS